MSVRSTTWVAQVTAGGLGVGAAVWTVAGGPAAVVLLAGAAAGALVGLLTARIATTRPGAWRVPSAVGAAALAAAATMWVAGRPTRDERGSVVLGIAVVLVAALVARPALGPARSRRSDQDGREPLDAVVGRMARPVPLDEVLQQVVDALRHAPGRRAVELWRVDGDVLTLTHRSPLIDRAPLAVAPGVVAAAVNAGVVGDTWLRIWFPALVLDGGSDRTRAVPLATHGELAGLVVLRREPGDPPFGPGDDERLARLQRPVAAALNQERLTVALERTVLELRARNADLQASRARLMSVAEEERRRLERDLHDGAQARLSALGVRLQLVRRLVAQDPDCIDELLHGIEAELADATAELRALAHGIMPPLLLTGGLGDALRGAASRLPIEVHVDVPSSERHRPEVEAAVYFCCLEALQNAVKHAGSDATATVSVQRAGDRLEFTVGDDGRGLNGAGAPGRGLVNMSDRIGALGGSVSIGPGEGGSGVRVSGQVPLGPADVAAR